MEMLTKENLMIGDWVLHDGKPKRVDMVWFDGYISLYDPSKTWGSIYGDKYPIEEITPIPLTASILTKNGFEHSMPYDDYTFDGLSLYHCGSGFAITGGPGIFNTRVRIDYLHQLRRLLWLCGIEKEVVV